MRTVMSRLPTKIENQVSQVRNDYTGMIELLCAECGWEGVCHPIDNVNNAFFLAHACRIVIDSVSRGD